MQTFIDVLNLTYIYDLTVTRGHSCIIQRSRVCDLMLLDISQARWTVSISQLQNKMCPFKGRLLKLQHFIVVSSQWSLGSRDCIFTHELYVCKDGNRNRGNQSIYFDKKTGFFFPPDLAGRRRMERDSEIFIEL